jgi:hypothetical protein
MNSVCRESCDTGYADNGCVFSFSFFSFFFEYLNEVFIIYLKYFIIIFIYLLLASLLPPSISNGVCVLSACSSQTPNTAARSCDGGCLFHQEEGKPAVCVDSCPQAHYEAVGMRRRMNK